VKRWYKVLAAAIALVAINASTQMGVRANLAAGLYPPQAAIDIPIMTTLYLSLGMVPCLLLLATLSRMALRPAIVMPALIALYAMAVYFAVGGLYYWTDIAHYSIGATYGLLILVLVGFAWDDVRVLRPRMAAEAPLTPLRPRAARQRTWYAVGALLFLYALPYLHNVGCIELPFGTGFDLALVYLGVPALAVAIFGGRWIGARFALISARAGALLVGAALFLWIVVLGQAYVVLANALMDAQRPVLYEGVVVEKLKTGFRGSDHILRVQVPAATRDVISMEVDEYDYARLKVGDRVTRPMVLGALQIPYIAHCRWLPYARHGGT